MGHCYSLDLRVRVADFVEAGHSCRAAAQHFDVSESFAIKLVRRTRDTGSPAPARQGRPPGRGKLVAYESFLIQTVEARLAITMPELAARLLEEHGIGVAPAMLSRFLCRCGFSYKKRSDDWGSGGAPAVGVTGMQSPGTLLKLNWSRSPAMELFVGLDVSVRATSVCVMDASGKVLKESKVETEPDAIGALLHSIGDHYKRVGLEAGPLSQWLCSGLAAAGYPVICVETRHMKAALSAQINKTDRNDARGIAQMMRAGLYKPVHVKTIRSQEIRMLLTARKFVQSKITDAENNLRGLLRNFGLKVGMVSRIKFEQRILELLEQSPHLRLVIESLLEVRRVLREQYRRLHKAMEQMAEADEVCQLLMTAPGVGSMAALSFRAGVDEPARFGQSRSVAAHFGLTPTRYQSGEIDHERGISKCGDPSVRWVLVEAAGALLRISKRSSPLKEWGLAVAKRRGMPKAIVAVARRLAVAC